MVNRSTLKKKSLSADWFVQGVLTKLGDTFDRFTGRGWKPSSSLATSELAEKLKALVDTEAREAENGRKFVPHQIQLKMQWDKFSTDSDGSLRKLEYELLTALVDHINDRHYYTYAPISLTVKPDYFINGIKLFAGFEGENHDEHEVSMDVTVPQLKIDPSTTPPDQTKAACSLLRVRFQLNGKTIERSIDVTGRRRLSIGRNHENDIAVNDTTVSKMHASLKLDTGNCLIVADTGSTNGTFIDGTRIAYGKASILSLDQTLRVGTIDLNFHLTETAPIEHPHETGAEIEEAGAAETYSVDEFEFTRKIDPPLRGSQEPAPTAPSIPLPKSETNRPLDPETGPVNPPSGRVDIDGEANVTK